MAIEKPLEFGRLEIGQLGDFENHNSIRLPADYRQFLVDTNGGRPSPNTIRVDTTTTDVQYLFGMHSGAYFANFFEQLDAFQKRIPSWYIPIGRDSGGNLFLMSLWSDNLGVIAFWDHQRESRSGEADQYFDNMKFVASSFSEFIKMLR